MITSLFPARGSASSQPDTFDHLAASGKSAVPLDQRIKELAAPSPAANASPISSDMDRAFYAGLWAISPLNAKTVKEYVVSFNQRYTPAPYPSCEAQISLFEGVLTRLEQEGETGEIYKAVDETRIRANNASSVMQQMLRDMLTKTNENAQWKIEW
ncbi:hypothetical protein ACL2XP_22945 [Sodalis sp. RH21]|uniref:hypothetical protein n=1 Tax=unclassified Sodalis (in: enterobacteria) TaxID=2636512 RepID=UPI0039B44344